MEFRKQLGIAPTGALDSRDLAHKLGVTVWSTIDVAGMPTDQLGILNDESDGSWAALTMRIGPSNLVVYKPVRSAERRNSVIMHELAHVILGHELAEAYMLEGGSLAPGNFRQDQEDEADWLAGALLLPRPALMDIRRRRLTDSVACRKFHVSPEMLNWRMRMTGVDYQLARGRNRRVG